MVKTGSNELFTLRRRPSAEKFVDNGFRNLALAMATMVAIILFVIFLSRIGATNIYVHVHLSVVRDYACVNPHMDMIEWQNKLVFGTLR